MLRTRFSQGNMKPRPRRPRPLTDRKIPAVLPGAFYSLQAICDHWQLGPEVFEEVRQFIAEHRSLCGAATENGDMIVKGETAVVAIFAVLRNREGGE